MTRPSLRYLSNESIEDVTARRIREYEAKAGVKVAFPVPAEEVIEQVLGLCFLWDQIEERPGEMILGGLSRKTRTIVLNVLLDLALRNEKAYRLWRKLTEGQDTAEQKSAVDRYQSAFLMPKWLLEGVAQRYDLTRWRDLYALADEAQVNISNLTTRLLRLGMIFIPKGEKTIYRSKDAFTGQRTLF